MDGLLESPFLCRPLGTLLQVSNQVFEVHQYTSKSDGQRTTHSTNRMKKFEGRKMYVNFQISRLSLHPVIT